MNRKSSRFRQKHNHEVHMARHMSFILTKSVTETAKGFAQVNGAIKFKYFSKTNLVRYRISCSK